MTGLLMKDFYTMGRKAKLSLVIIAIFALLPNSMTHGYAILFGALLPSTAMAYDERADFARLAMMMPLSKRDIVFSKYVMGYIGTIVLSIVVLISSALFGVVSKSDPFTGATVMITLITACMAFILLALNLPAIFILGAEKGRMVLIMLIVAAAAFVSLVMGGTTDSDNVAGIISKIMSVSPAVLAGGLLAVTVVINVISIAFTVKTYKRRNV